MYKNWHKDDQSDRLQQAIKELVLVIDLMLLGQRNQNFGTWKQTCWQITF